MRRLIAFACAGETLMATHDEGSLTTGLLIVSGGNEVRSGAHRGMAMLAAEMAGLGYPVFRYDRRGVGDSSGENRGFLSAADDLAAAVDAFRAQAPHLTRLAGFGNCDAASTLALFGRDAGIDTVLLANPWVIEDTDGMPPAAAIRARYLARLRDPLSLIRRGANVRKAWHGLRKIATPRPAGTLARRVTAAIEEWGADATVILAEGDATAIAFRDAARGVPVETIATDSHSFARASDRVALRHAVVRLLALASQPPEH